MFTIVVSKPGCLPESDPTVVATREEALVALERELSTSWFAGTGGNEAVDDGDFNLAVSMVRGGDLGPIYLEGYVHQAHHMDQGVRDALAA